MQLPSFILSFLTSATLRCGYRRVPESCWQHTVCHSNKPLPARSCARPDAGARSCGFKPKCGVTSPCPLSLLVGLADVPIGEIARGSSRILSGSPRSATAICARGFLSRHRHAPRRRVAEQGAARPRQYRARQPDSLRPDRDLERDRARSEYFSRRRERGRAAGHRPSRNRTRLDHLAQQARGSAASISGCTIRTSSIPTPTG